MISYAAVISHEPHKALKNPYDLADTNRLAYSGHTSGTPGPVIVFCDGFWRAALPHLWDRVNGKPTRALANLQTMEHVILHEIMHSDIAGFTEHIEDIRTTLPGETDDVNIPGGVASVAVYGVTRCKKLAQKKSPNLQTLKNADNYAWFSTSMFFSKAWGFTVDESDGFVDGSADPIPEAYLLVNSGNTYADDDWTDAEWST
jgi:hypothetical protein